MLWTVGIFWLFQPQQVDSDFRAQRIKGWREFVKSSRAKQKKLHDWIKRVSVKLGAAGLHWGLREPVGDVEVRAERASGRALPLQRRVGSLAWNWAGCVD